LLRFRKVLNRDFKDPRVAFEMLDKNRDNIVTRNEWLSTLEVVGKSAKWDTDTMAMMLQYGEKFFNVVDSNGNGELTYDEFKENLTRKIEPTLGTANLAEFKKLLLGSFANPRDAFDSLGLNSDGDVAKEEWLACLAQLGKKQNWGPRYMDMVDSCAEAFFDLMDTNMDGLLLFSEFKENLLEAFDEVERPGAATPRRNSKRGSASGKKPPSRTSFKR
jgi:Ca2+-binding EF-hand superfamily protein